MEDQDRLQCHKCRKIRKSFFHFDSDSNRYCPRCAYYLRHSGWTIYDINSPDCPHDIFYSCFSRKQKIENAKNKIREGAEQLRDGEEAEEREEYDRRERERLKEDDVTILDPGEEKVRALNKRLHGCTPWEIKEYKKRTCGVCFRHEKDFEEGRILETNWRAQGFLYGGCNKCGEIHQNSLKEKQKEIDCFKKLVESCSIEALKASCRKGICRCGREFAHLCLQRNRECARCKAIFDARTPESKFTRQMELCIDCWVAQQDDPEAMIEDMKEQIRYSKKWEREGKYDHLKLKN